MPDHCSAAVHFTFLSVHAKRIVASLAEEPNEPRTV